MAVTCSYKETKRMGVGGIWRMRVNWMGLTFFSPSVCMHQDPRGVG